MRLSVCLILLFLVGCANVPEEVAERAEKYSITADAEGDLLSPETLNRIAITGVEPYFDGVLQNLRLYVDGNPGSPVEGSDRRKVKVLIFIHGGLNQPSAGVYRAGCWSDAIIRDEDLSPEARKACKNGKRFPQEANPPYPASGYFPIFINWRSGLWTSYGEHLVATRQGERWNPVLGWGTSPFVLLADVGRGVFRAPMVWFQSGRNGLASYRGTPPFREKTVVLEHYKELRNSSDAVSVSIGRDHGPPGVTSPFRDSNDGDYYDGKLPDGSYWEGAAASFSWLITLPTKIIGPPIIDGGGKPAWDIMNRRTELLRRQPKEFDLIPPDEIALDPGRTGVVSDFIGRLSETIDAIEASSNKDVEVTLIGHSMGTIVANWIVADFGAQLRPDNLVYFAAATKIRDFENSVVPYLDSDHGSHARFYNLTLHPRAEVRETNLDVVVDFAPRGSLLVWIDNFLANPESFLDRTLGRWDNIVVATHIFPQGVRDRVHIKAFGICRWGEKKTTTNPEEHGQFTDGSFWRKSFWLAEDNYDNQCAR